MLAVADTSPLNYLVSIDLVEILPKLYGRIVIPPDVRAELLAPDAPRTVRVWAQDPPSWISIQSPTASGLADPRLHSLDRGESAAIALAIELHPAMVLIDERAGSAMARDLGLPVTGTLGVLDEAARRKLIALPDAIHRLRRTSFRYPKNVVAKLLQEDAART